MNRYIYLLLVGLFFTFQAAYTQSYEGTFKSASYNCPIENMAEGYIITPQGNKIEVASYPAVLDGQYIKIENSSWEIKKCNDKTYNVLYVYKVQQSNANIQYYEGVFTKVNYKCPIEGTIEGYLTTSSGSKIEIASALNITDGQYIKVNGATWKTKTCEDITYRIYYINSIQGSTAKSKTEIYPEQTKTEKNLPTIVVPGTSSTGSKITVEDARDALEFHNKIRKEVGVEPLSWSIELSKFAQEWADYLANQNCMMMHRPQNTNPNNYGENIFRGNGGSYTVLFASQSWYSEIKDYRNEPVSSKNLELIGHYTQMVWRKTTKVGIGIANCSNGGVIIVANYDPPGNYIGQKPY